MENLDDFVDDSFFQFDDNNESEKQQRQVSNTIDEAETAQVQLQSQTDVDVVSLLKQRIELIGKSIENLQLQLNEKHKWHQDFIKDFTTNHQIVCETSLQLKYPLNVVSHWLRTSQYFCNPHQLIVGFHIFNPTFKSASNLNVILDTNHPITYETRFYLDHGLEFNEGASEGIIQREKSMYIVLKIELPSFEYNQIMNFNGNLCYNYVGKPLQIPLPTFKISATNICNADYRIHLGSDDATSIEDLLSFRSLFEIRNTCLEIKLKSNSNKSKFIKYLRKLQFVNIHQEIYWLCEKFSNPILIWLFSNSSNEIIIAILSILEEDQLILAHYLKENIPEQFTASALN